MEDQAKYNAQVERTRLRLFLESEKVSCKNIFVLSHDGDKNSITVTNPYYPSRKIEISLYAKWNSIIDCEAVIVPETKEEEQQEQNAIDYNINKASKYNTSALMLIIGMLGFWIIIGLILCGII